MGSPSCGFLNGILDFILLAKKGRKRPFNLGVHLTNALQVQQSKLLTIRDANGFALTRQSRSSSCTVLNRRRMTREKIPREQYWV